MISRVVWCKHTAYPVSPNVMLITFGLFSFAAQQIGLACGE